MSEKVLDITKDERMLISRLKNRPGMYLGRIELTRFINWVVGYACALTTTRLYSERVLLPDGLNDYAAMKYLGHTRTSLNCFHIILEKEPDEEKAFDLFWELLDEYLISLGYEPIPDWVNIWNSIKEEWGNFQKQEYIKRINTCEKNRNITNDERILLSSLKRRPGMYLGITTLTNFTIWIFSYKEALKITGLYSERVILPDGFQDYTAMKYLGYTETAMGWASLILEKEPDEKKAFFVFFELLDEYLVSHGYEPIPLFEDIEDELKKQRNYKKS